MAKAKPKTKPKARERKPPQRMNGEYKKRGLVTIEMDSFAASLFAPEKLRQVELNTPGLLAQNRSDIVEEHYIMVDTGHLGGHHRARWRDVQAPGTGDRPDHRLPGADHQGSAAGCCLRPAQQDRGRRPTRRRRRRPGRRCPGPPQQRAHAFLAPGDGVGGHAERLRHSGGP